MYGIECFVSNNDSFIGKIKEHHQDFEVREINEEGVVAELSNILEIVQKCDSIIENRKAPISHFCDCSFISSENTKVENSFTCEEMVSNQIPKIELLSPLKKKTKNLLPEKETPSFCEDDTGKQETAEKKTLTSNAHGQKIEEEPHELIRSLLKKDIFEQLGNMTFDSESSGTTKIGVVTEKSDRTKIHQCIRYVFPHLKTIVTKDNLGQNEISVTKDPVYKEFIEANILKKDLDKFFRFVHCQLILQDKSTFALRTRDDKEQRTKLHHLIRQHYGSFLESKSFTSKNQENVMNIRFRQKRKFNEIGASLPNGQSKEILRFILCKRNIETSDAISRLSFALKTKPSSFSFAGSKDKKAVTFQSMTVENVEMSDLEFFARQSKGREIEICSIKKTEEMLRLGDLSGNFFKIIVRDIKSDKAKKPADLIEKAVSNVRTHGFVNYFGTQRFGFEENAVNSADIGLAMLKGHFMKSVDMILTPTENCPEADDAKRYFQETQDVSGTLNKMPTWRTREVSILKGLNQHGYSENGCFNALFGLPYHVRLLYVHSYCSLLWNQIVTSRIKKFGLFVVEGDIIEVDTNPKMYSAATKDDVIAKKYKISQVVLPLPGFRINFPNNMAFEYEDKLKEDGLIRENFKQRKLRLNVPGVYRKLIAYPKDINWMFHADTKSNDEETICYQGCDNGSSDNNTAYCEPNSKSVICDKK